MRGLGRGARLEKTIAVGAVLWHLTTVYVLGWGAARTWHTTHDFASYHYAARIAWSGHGDPYETEALNRALWRDKVGAETLSASDTRGGAHQRREPAPTLSSTPPPPLRIVVPRETRPELAEHHPPYPFLYPPQFLVAMGWTTHLELFTAYRLWFFACEAAFWLAVVTMALWTRRLDRRAPLVVVVAACVAPFVVDNLVWGQTNLPTLALTVAGLWQVDRARRAGATSRDRRARALGGGALVGVAALLKMTPALFVLWWLLRRDRLAVLGALTSAALLTAISLACFGVEIHLRFFGEVLPSLLAGDFNTLTRSLPITHESNHSFAAVTQSLFAVDAGSSIATALTLGWTALVLGAVCVAAAVVREEDRFTRPAQAAAFALVPLLVSRYTFFHHLVWVLPAVVVAALALARERLGRRWLLPLGLAWTVYALPGGTLERVAHWPGQPELVAELVRLPLLIANVISLAAVLHVGHPSPGMRAA